MKINLNWLSSFSNKKLELILFVTEQCNFRCVYCYEDFKLGGISLDIIEGVKNLIKKRIDTIETLTLSFFGGEPLLNKTAIIDISNWAMQICKANNVKYLGSITTNGYSLDNETFEKLIQNQIIHFQITLDGEKQAHDKLRPTLNSKSTFDKIYSNLVMMANSQHDFNCTLRLNIADSNFNSVKSFINNYSTPFSNSDKFSFHFHPIFGMSELKLTKKEQLNELKELAMIKGLRYNTLDHNDNPCYAARADSFVIRTNGIVQKCTVALSNPINNIGEICKDGTMNIDQKKLKKWIFAENKSCPIQSLALEKLAVPYENSGKYINENVL